MLAALVIVSAVLGAAIGSFGNVVIARVPAGESVVRPASHCPGCGHAIRRRHNVPIVSYVALRGRCADCQSPIGIRYPLIEAATAAGFVAASLLALGRDVPALIPAWWYLVAIGIMLAAIDVASHRLPNAIVLPSYPVIAVLLLVAAIPDADWWALARAGIGAAALFGFYLLLLMIYPAGMGWGDVKLAGLLGGLTGFVSWGALVVGAFAGFLVGAAVAVGVMATGRGTGKTALPFGPFMLIGAAIGIAAGTSLAGGYVGILGV